MGLTTVYVFDGERLRPLEAPVSRPLRWAAWRPAPARGRDGSAALLVGNGGTLLLFDGQRFEAVPTATSHNLRGVAWSPDGATALLVGNRGAVLRYDGRAVEALESPTVENLRRVAWRPAEATRPGGDFALIVGNAGTVLRFSPSEGLVPVPGDRAHTLRAVAWRPDGAYALIGAYASRWVGYPRPHALYRCDGRYLQALLTTDEEDDLVAIDWHPEGQEALIVGYAYPLLGQGLARNKLLRYDGSGFAYQQVEASGLLWGLGWHPSGEYALLLGERGCLLKYSVKGGIEQLTTGIDENLVGPFWKPDGSLGLILKGPGDKVYTV